MLIVNEKTKASRESVLRVFDKTKDMATGNPKLGRPTMILKEKDGKIRLYCQYIGGASRDFGKTTYFIGRLRERDGETRLRGVVVTEPLFHIPFIALLVFFVWRCISLGAFNVVPVCLAVFCIFMFRGEYAKQPLIKGHIKRVFKVAERHES